MQIINNYSQYKNFQDFCDKNNLSIEEAILFLKKEIEKLKEKKENE